MATNTLDAYSPQLYANEALEVLKNTFGLARRLNRNYDDERRSFELGDVVTIRKPANFVAASAPSAAQNLSTGKVQISLNNWQEVKFELPDNQMAFAGERIIREHVIPMSTALSTKVETDLNTMVVQCPHVFSEASGGGNTSATIAGILGTWRKLFDNKAPTIDEANMFFEVGGKEWADLTGLAAFSQWQGAGALGVQTQVSAHQLGRRYGFEFYPTQLRPTLSYADITDKAGAINNGPGYVAGTTSIAVNGLDASGVYKKGTVIKMTSGTDNGSEYTLTADATMTTGAATITIFPGLRNAVANADTFNVQTEQDNASVQTNFAFHRNFGAVVFAPLPDFADRANRLGADVSTVTDPDSGISVRARIYYVGGSSKIECALDVLYGFSVLQPEYGCRYEVIAS